MQIRRIAGFLIAGILTASGAARADSAFMDEPPSHFFPGKYFEQKAQFYLRMKQYSAALDMFELAGYWADKRAQYNVAVMLFNGIGIPVDKVRGVAWFHIAAESHEELPTAALKAASSELTEEQLRQAEVVWHELDAKYGDAITLPRAIDRYISDTHGMTNFGFAGGNLKVTESGGDGLAVSGSDFLSHKKEMLDALIRQITGDVKVGAIQPLDVAADARKNASSTVIETGEAPSPVATPHD
jgi:hypothetical protein